MALRVDDTQEAGIPRTFRNARMALDAISSGVVLVDRSHWGRMRLVGKDRLDFLHNQSTADFKAMKPGTGCDTVSRSGFPFPQHLHTKIRVAR